MDRNRKRALLGIGAAAAIGFGADKLSSATPDVLPRSDTAADSGSADQVQDRAEERRSGETRQERTVRRMEEMYDDRFSDSDLTVTVDAKGDYHVFVEEDDGDRRALLDIEKGDDGAYYAWLSSDIEEFLVMDNDHLKRAGEGAHITGFELVNKGADIEQATQDALRIMDAIQMGEEASAQGNFGKLFESSLAAKAGIENSVFIGFDEAL